MKKINSLCTGLFTAVDVYKEEIITSFMLILGVAFLTAGLADGSYANVTTVGAGFEHDRLNDAVRNLFELIEGSFGAIIMIAAGLGAIVSAAFGAYRAAVGLLVVAVGAFILRALVALFFGDY